jgi:hypothetical protein
MAHRRCFMMTLVCCSFQFTGMTEHLAWFLSRRGKSSCQPSGSEISRQKSMYSRYKLLNSQESPWFWENDLAITRWLISDSKTLAPYIGLVVLFRFETSFMIFTISYLQNHASSVAYIFKVYCSLNGCSTCNTFCNTPSDIYYLTLISRNILIVNTRSWYKFTSSIFWHGIRLSWPCCSAVGYSTCNSWH